MAEAHPVGFRWVMKVKERTNACAIVDESFRDTEDLDGVFSGYDPETGAYDPISWMYGGCRVNFSAGPHEHATQAFSEHTGAGMLVDGLEHDETLEHPRCVFQILRRHFARYTPEVVQRISGISHAEFMAVADALIANSGRERTSMFCYANGWTQHSGAVQMIRSAAILQLLVGNVGRPGGGIMAMRGHASIQGSTDIPTLYDLLPGYLHMPWTREGHLTLEEYIGAGKADRGWWSHFDTYIVSLLKAWFGEAATESNDYAFGWLPKLTGNHSHFSTMLRALDSRPAATAATVAGTAPSRLPGRSRRRTGGCAALLSRRSTGRSSTPPCGAGKSRPTSGSAGWHPARRSSRSHATRPATTAPPRSRARSCSAPWRPRPSS